MAENTRGALNCQLEALAAASNDRVLLQLLINLRSHDRWQAMPSG